MRVLLIGSGGREHALGWKLGQSPRLEKLFVAPGNAGTARVGENVALDTTDHSAVIAFAGAQHIDLVIVGPEAPLVDGLVDSLTAAGILAFGPSREAARLEGSKAFTKAICDRFAIPTAAYARFDSAEAALAYVAGRPLPLVVKADGLAAGKGVTIAMTRPEAEDAIRACFAGAFGAAGHSLVIEDFLEGEEASLFAISDGTRYVLLPGAQDHKRAYDGDEGPNTGGMGAYSPAPVLTPEILARADREIIGPTISGMAAMNTPFRGVLFAGLMVTTDGPKLIEYNVRFGDPECQVLMMRLKSDLLELLVAAARGDLSAVAPPAFSDEVALTVVMAANGYPGAYDRGSEIRGVDGLDAPGLKVFHAGTEQREGRLLAAGGRVLNVTALAPTVKDARDRAYAAIAEIDWPGGFCRGDIGWRAVARDG